MVSKLAFDCRSCPFRKVRRCVHPENKGRWHVLGTFYPVPPHWCKRRTEKACECGLVPPYHTEDCKRIRHLPREKQSDALQNYGRETKIDKAMHIIRAIDNGGFDPYFWISRSENYLPE